MLLDLCRRFADAHADRNGAVTTPVPGLTMVRALKPGELQISVSRPMIAIALQGRKRVTFGSENHDYGAGEALVISADVPTVSQITQASPAEPYYALVLEFDITILHDLAQSGGSVDAEPVRVERVDADVVDAAHRLVRLLDRPEALTTLSGGLMRELHYWLLNGSHGSAIRSLGRVDSHAGQIARAVGHIRQNYTRSVRIRDLARIAHMSEPAFHAHFKAITTLTPLQFQKQLRLIEARRLMLTEGRPIAVASGSVGYASVPHFTRDYGRLFGTTPGRDIKVVA
ncbi:AraC family transcriptional regulator [Falsirhodobacter halotolerans]|uniref:AraC family transcriptional regulator n=1 Tax=Falsirhodobacter halotolerans TaxID=1146892 RepID=UPI001FD28FF5|nr:AraC family transcriptional regulator [Falsirhodobacter halotolerans]MCJ8140090.1 AraC family transcriptional regulator [Falsirhodobacter halotolerans]